MDKSINCPPFHSFNTTKMVAKIRLKEVMFNITCKRIQDLKTSGVTVFTGIINGLDELASLERAFNLEDRIEHEASNCLIVKDIYSMTIEV